MLLHATDEVAFTQIDSPTIRVGSINACRSYIYVITVNSVSPTFGGIPSQRPIG